ncbi:antitoxin ParD1/3/4 [Ochrobactrum sp. RC6B]|uniref:Antitoxin ParD1/3/4 n=2 Tax=Brucella intermedia TaxID=94625 RepID=A0ABR6AVG8_9HYPH|nr:MULTISPECIES: type II toxin-antitoxin system ParD family antitoxin [Pseudomonadota]MDH7785564.1 antitoxin ParD1/3/4 [Ochrobactrum sp. 19YEA23]KAB2706092.1 type II toxin-antitoxin system ParD family antitoxin [Brucella intermedia]MBA8853221.1 antitoxin ParD1/3/4 [Brucella intermedia]MBB3217272.1 antitoxin ParD1/3/4 [Ochrobactrum sp. RC6B]MDH0125955.1 type II toxin-antitoxin system ParD family antitoxin [Brucella intermedia GD04153]
MANIEKRTISLPSEQAAFIDSKIKTGDYASVSEVVRAGIRALRERDAAIERWLKNDVAASYDAMTSDPSRAVSVDSALDSIRQRHAKRKKDLK